MTMTFQLDGRLARDPEVGTTADSRQYIRITVATDRAKGDQADFFTVTVFDHIAEVRHAVKGDRVAVTGTARQNIWDATDGSTRYDIGFVARTIDWQPQTTRTPAATTSTSHNVTEPGPAAHNGASRR